MPDALRRTPAILLWAALGLLSLHALADAVAQPEPGADLVRHVPEALAVMAVLALAAVAGGRLRAGAVAAISLALVPPALLGFGLAVADASAHGARGDDWTGFLLLPAAIALLTSGAMLLWRSRRRDGHVVVRRALIALAALVFLFEVEAGVLLAIYATHRPHDAPERIDLGAPASTVSLRTSDGVNLVGHYVRPRNGAAVILYPRAAGAQRHARMLVHRGFGVLALDARGYGASQGDPNAFGWGNTRDIDAAVAYLRRRDEVLPGGIGGLGLSVGGEQMLDAAAGNPSLAAVVSDGAGERSVRETLTRGWRAALAIPEGLVQTSAIALFSGHRPPPSLTSVGPRISPRAAFFIYAQHGAGGEDLNRMFYDRAHQPKQIWRVPGAGHTGGLQATPHEYERRVVAFLSDHLRHFARANARPERRATQRDSAGYVSTDTTAYSTGTYAIVSDDYRAGRAGDVFVPAELLGKVRIHAPRSSARSPSNARTRASSAAAPPRHLRPPAPSGRSAQQAWATSPARGSAGTATGAWS
jgi:uncharacterized protein